MATPFICIDGSYFVFYRVHATLNWWKLAKKDTYDSIKNTPHESAEFVAKFCELCLKSIEKLAKYHKVGTDRVIIAKDCPRANIWRMSLYPEYKGTRKSSGVVGAFFDIFYNTWTGCVLQHPNLEADDCIALFVKYNTPARIIANDNDYLQLVCPEKHVELWDLTNKNIGEKRSKSTIERPNWDVFVKIINGDVSDNISPAYGKTLTPKQLDSLYCECGGDFRAIEHAIVARNRTLVCFDYIPDIYQIEA